MTNVIIAFRKMFVYLNDGTEGRGLPLLVGSPKGLSNRQGWFSQNPGAWNSTVVPRVVVQHPRD